MGRPKRIFGEDLGRIGGKVWRGPAAPEVQVKWGDPPKGTSKMRGAPQKYK